MRFHLDSGVMRSGTALITLSGPRDHDAPVTFNLLRGRKVVATVVRRWPVEFEFDQNLQAGESMVPGTISIAGVEAHAPVTSVDVIISDESVPQGKRWQLRQLYATSERQFVKFFFRSKNRIKDRETVLFSTIQTLQHYHLDPSHRCVAAVIYAYRALDLRDATHCQDAARYLEDCLRQADQLHKTDHPRTDRSHLIVSVRCALWQLYLYMGRFEDFEQHLTALSDFLRTEKDVLPGIILNGCISMFLTSYIDAVRGYAERAAETVQFNAAFYMTNLVKMKPSAVTFRETLQSHTAVMLGLETVDLLHAGKAIMKPEQAVSASHRLLTSPSVPTLIQNFAAYCSGLRVLPAK